MAGSWSSGWRAFAPRRSGSAPIARSTSLSANWQTMGPSWPILDPHQQGRATAPFRVPRGDPYKAWKLTEEDWRNREKWDLYEAAVNDMLSRRAPSRPRDRGRGKLQVVARVKTLKTLVDVLREG